jgi:predicted nucleic acid-binding protein
VATAVSMILCDTNILIEFYKNNAGIVSTLRQIGIKQLAISSITQAELYFGAIDKQEMLKIKKHLALLHILPIDVSISDRFIQLMETYSLSHKLSIPDALIAATALTHKIELYTLNTKDFHFISGLKLYKVPTT